jgi:hypothetical protein
MNLLKVDVDNPAFPIRIYRPPEVREQWIASGLAPFRMSTPSHVSTYHPSAPAKEVKDGRKVFLEIPQAWTVVAIGEVWDASRTLCRIWFSARNQVYEAALMNGWNPTPSTAPVSKGKISTAAQLHAEFIAQKFGVE